MKHLNITRFSFDYKSGSFVKNINGKYVYRINHEKAVSEIIFKSKKEEIHIATPHSIAICKGIDGSIIPRKISYNIENKFQLKNLFLTYEDHCFIIDYLNDQHKPRKGGIKRYNLYRFDSNKYKMMEMSKGKWIHRKDHIKIIDNVYQNFDLSQIRFPSIDGYRIVNNEEDSCTIEIIEKDTRLIHKDLEIQWSRYKDHQNIIGDLEHEIIG